MTLYNRTGAISNMIHPPESGRQKQFDVLIHFRYTASNSYREQHEILFPSAGF
jgi:hypothetical protein